MIGSFVRKFIGLFQGQADLLEAETVRRNVKLGMVAREIIDFGIPRYKKFYKLPPTYPTNNLKHDEIRRR